MRGPRKPDNLTDLLERRLDATGEAVQWLGDVWDYLLAGGLGATAGGPADEGAIPRLRLKDRMQEVASRFDAAEVRAEADRISAHVLNACERYQEAVPFYERAIPELEALGREEDAARTRLGFSAVLQMSGAYGQALEVCQEADGWFHANGDEHGHARALTNIGNTHHRLDQHAQALECHLESTRLFEKLGDARAVAVASSNVANSYAFLDRFEDSDRMYGLAESAGAELGMPSLADQARYNRAYLYFLRGRYSEAIAAFNRLRRHFARNSGSHRHAGLCDLDQSEVYLQLNLPDDAAELARAARRAFDELGLRYEEAKALTFLAVAQTQKRRYMEALEILKEAGPMFASEGNAFWAGMIELYRAEVLLSLGRFWEARFLARTALERFDALGMASQRGMALVVLGRTGLATNRLQDASRMAGELLALIETNRVPLLRYPAHMLCAQVAEIGGRLVEARRHYEYAAECIEEHRSYLHHDELRVRFLEGKERVYEALVRLGLDGDGEMGPPEAFEWCERAKARALADLLGQHLPAVHVESDPVLLDRIHRLREELNSQYVRSRPEAGEWASAVPPEHIASTEKELERNLRQLCEADACYGSLFGSVSGTLDQIQKALSRSTTLVEFYVARGEVMVFILDRSGLRLRRRLCSIEQIQQLRLGLDFQMQKFGLGSGYLEDHRDQMLRAATEHLERLFDALFREWIDDIETTHMVVVPHGELHALPFHAFWDGDRYLADRVRISYAPSAEVFRLTLEARRSGLGSGLVVGHTDRHAPGIADEVGRLQTLMPESRVLFGEEATRSRFFKSAGAAGFIHIATHSFFRKDNPMFSGFHLADGPVTALDLYSQSWPCDFVMLSGCSSAAALVAGGDDLMGLVRGFLYAGARTLAMSLWNVSDEATVALTEAFYGEWRRGAAKAEALGEAMRRVRARYPHPFYWAPFVLIGAP